MPLEKPKVGKKEKKRMRRLEEQRAEVSAMQFLKDFGDPKNLRGKALGLWYRDRQKLLSSDPNNLISKAARSLTKQERKALKKAEKLANKEGLNRQFQVEFDSYRSQMIEEFFESVVHKPPTFLIPQYEYYKRLVEDMRSGEEYEEEEYLISNLHDLNLDSYDVENAIPQLYELVNNFPCLTQDFTLNQIDSFLKGDVNTTCVNDVPDYESPYTRNYDDDNDSGKDEGYFESIDKYKHLEDSTFKNNFLQVISQSIETYLRKSLKHTCLTRDSGFDAQLLRSFLEKQNKRMKKERERLPAFKMQKEILHLIRDNQVVLITGETGCGKTTQVAQFILDDAIQSRNGSLCSIVCTQPRRISAVSVAQRVSQERGESVGCESVGYQIRLERKVSRTRGAILYCTTGILLQYMQRDPALLRYSHIIMDEIHERDTLCDFVLTILRDISDKRRDLKIVLMSATLNAERFSHYFSNCPAINIPGYTYPVRELYLEDVLLKTGFSYERRSRITSDDPKFATHVIPYVNSIRTKYPDYVIEGLCNPLSEQINIDLIVELIKHICSQLGPGAILVFMPGWEDINSLVKAINASNFFFCTSKFLIIPLHSMLPTTNQQSVFECPKDGQRKIVVATNIAETSITIDDVVFVIDCGKVKIKNYDLKRNVSTLKPQFVSKANARQRKGRAGRVQDGYCFHLFSRGRERVLEDYPLPEMLRTRLEEVILTIKLLQLGKVAPFLQKVMDPPNPRAVSLSLELLVQLNALDENENLTPLGFHLAKLPLDPQIGKMLLLGVIMNCLNPILNIASTLSFKDPFLLPLLRNEQQLMHQRKLALDYGHKSDHLIMATVLDQWEQQEKRGQGRVFCTTNYLIRGTLFQLRDQKSLFMQYLHEMGFVNCSNYRDRRLNKNSSNIGLVKAVITAGLYPNVAIITNPRKDSKQKNLINLRTAEDGIVRLHPKSVNTLQTTEFENRFLIYHEKLLSSGLFIYDSTMVPPLPLLVFSHDFFVSYKNERAVIHLNKDLEFGCEKETAESIIELKLRMNWLLEYKLSHPAQIMWEERSSEIALLKIMTHLFTKEEDLIMGMRYVSSDEDDD